VERLSVRYAALACVIAGGMLISGPSVVASADDGTSGDSTSSAGDSQSTDTSSTSHGFLSSLLGLHWLSQSPTANAPAIGPVAPPLMNMPNVVAPGTSPNGPNLVPAFELPNPGNTHWLAVAVPGSAAPTRGGQQPAIAPEVDSHGAGSRIAPQSQAQQQGGNTSPTISLVPLAPSGAPAGRTITITNPLPGANPIDLSKPLLPQVLPSPLVMLLTVIAKEIPFLGPVITTLLNLTVPSFIADFVNTLLPGSVGSVVPTLSPGALLPATMPAALSPSRPPPADVAPMGMDVPEAPAQQGPTSPTDETAGPPTAPHNGVSPLGEPVEFRAGYSDYLRNAGIAQITAIAVPGAVAILLFSLSGGFIGYRQARAGHIIRTEGITRFLR
jgi:hypothetical protein